MSRFAHDRRVFFVEEPVYDAEVAHIVINEIEGVSVLVPHLPQPLESKAQFAVRGMIRAALARYDVRSPVAWFYTPMALPLLAGLEPSVVVFDCMDELAGFANAPAEIGAREQELLARADVVFTGGHSLYEAKRNRHRNIHPFPSGVDVAHFAQARERQTTPPDQHSIPGPRIGFCGVIDERMDRGLVDTVAARRPEWQFILIGPVVKIDPAVLPRRPNIHYLGMKSYNELPSYLAGWDVAIMPFAHNDATRFISPTKTPEYLAAGCPVVSTSIRDVVRPYGEERLVEIADTPEEFEAAVVRSMTPSGPSMVNRAASRLKRMSWDDVYERMNAHVDALERQRRPAPRTTLRLLPPAVYVREPARR